MKIQEVILEAIVPPKYMDGSVIIEVDRPLFAPYFGAASPVRRTRRPRFDVEDLGRAATGEPRLRQQLSVSRRSAFGSIRESAAERPRGRVAMPNLPDPK